MSFLKKLLSVMPVGWPLSLMCVASITIVLHMTFVDWSWSSLVFSTLLGVLGALGSILFFAHRDAQLRARMQSLSPITWAVHLNGVHVGTINDAEYAAILRSARSSSRMLVAQVLNLANTAVNMAGRSIFLIPVTAFWLLFGLAFIAPDTITETMLNLSVAPPQSIASIAVSLLSVSAIVVVFVLGTSVLQGDRFGFRNRYDEAVNEMLRMRCGVAAEGNIELIAGDSQNFSFAQYPAGVK